MESAENLQNNNKQNEKPKEKNSIFKVMVLGGEYVGKTNILTRLCSNEFNNYTQTTIGIDMMIKTIQYKEEKVKLKIWDTASQMRFRAIVQTYLNFNNGIVIVYDITNRTSFEQLDDFIINMNLSEDPNTIKFLLGNKTDLEKNRKVSYDEAEKYAKSFGFTYFEVSAKSSNNIENVFFSLAENMILKENTEDFPNKIKEEIVNKPILGQTSYSQETKIIRIKETENKSEPNKQKIKKDKPKCFKILVLGDSKVGKTNIILRFCSNEFNDSYNITIGIDFLLKNIKNQESNVKFQFFDTAGEERFQSITKTIYNNADGIVVVYDITDRKSFEGLEYYFKEIALLTDKKKIKCLFGNKTDMEDKRIVPYEEAEKYAKNWGCLYFEGSAKNSNNIEKLFLNIGEKIDMKQNEQELESEANKEKENLTYENEINQKNDIEENKIESPKESENKIEPIKQLEIHYKILVVGGEKVGKTNIISRFCSNQFKEFSFSTKGFDFTIGTLQYKENKLKLHIWDMPSDERFYAVIKSFFKGADGIVVVYDITNKSSFECAKSDMKNINNSENPNTVKFLLGNKTDLVENRTISYEEAEKYAQSVDFIYFEASAKSSDNIEKMFSSFV